MEDTEKVNELTIGDIIDFLLAKGMTNDQISAMKVSVFDSTGGNDMAVLSDLAVDKRGCISIDVVE